MNHLYLSSLLILILNAGLSQTAYQYSVLAQASAESNPPRIHLTWNVDGNATTYIIYRKSTDTENWGAPILNTPGNEYIDSLVVPGEIYDYRIVKSASSYTGYGYVRASLGAELQRNRGDALIITTELLAGQLNIELSTLLDDYRAEGYRPHLLTVSEDTTVAYVKSLISQYGDSLDELNTIFIVGHVPVPYSGNLAPDGHVPDHQGAWPADVYYADSDGIYTDNAVNNSAATDPRNDNVAGDGKFDQSIIPGNGQVEYRIGRVDFANLSYFTDDEVALTKAYLDRSHAYKHKEWTLPARALIDDNFGGFGGEAFASNGWRNFAPLLGADSIFTGDYRSDMAGQGYLFSYGCGGGSHESASGIGTSTQLATDSLLTGFTMLFGSYFGDWDRQNNFMRTALAQGRTLSIAWAGRPWWYFHPMGLGASIGECAQLTQGNNLTFVPNYGGRYVHVALLGDPALRMEYIAPPGNFTADSTDTFHIALNWTASADPNIDGYHIYRKVDQGPWERVNSSPIQGTSHIDSCVLQAGKYVYQITAARLTEGYSGSYFNESLAATDSVTFFVNKTPQLLSHDAVQQWTVGDSMTFNATYTWSNGIRWIFGDTVIYEDSFIEHIGSLNPNWMNFTITYQIVLDNGCASDTTEGVANFFVWSIGDLGEHKQVRIYPNPVKSGSVLHVDVQESLPVSVFDLRGRCVQQGALQEGKILLEHLPAGVYTLQVGLETPMWNKLIVVP